MRGLRERAFGEVKWIIELGVVLLDIVGSGVGGVFAETVVVFHFIMFFKAF